MSRRLWWACVAGSLALGSAGQARAQDLAAAIEMREMPRPLPDLSFVDAEGRGRSLADFAGKAVVLNVWATWCAPCREELPALERLQAELGGPGFHVVALSTDVGGDVVVRRLYRELDLSEAGIYIDTSGSAMRDLGIYALPTTLLIDTEGQEVGRVTGAAAWDSAEAIAFIRRAMFDEIGVEASPSP